MGFVPPLNLGGFQPSPATLAQWVYQIWQYLQENPIATQEQLQEYIGTFITTSPETQAMIGAGVEEYLTENPPTAPVQSVQGKTGSVQLAYNEIVHASNAVPVYKASSTPNTNTLVGQYNLGYRLFVNTATQEIFTISPAGALSLVGRGKIDGTNIDLNSAQGDTTIAEAVTEVSEDVTSLNTSVGTIQDDVTALKALSRSAVTGSQYTFVTNELVKRGDVVTLSLRFVKNANNNYGTIGTIPEGFRPASTLTVRVVSDSTSGCPIIVQTTGEILTTTSETTYGDIRLVMTYVV